MISINYRQFTKVFLRHSDKKLDDIFEIRTQMGKKINENHTLLYSELKTFTDDGLITCHIHVKDNEIGGISKISLTEKGRMILELYKL